MGLPHQYSLVALANTLLAESSSNERCQLVPRGAVSQDRNLTHLQAVVIHVLCISKVDGHKLGDDTLCLHPLCPAVRCVQHNRLHTQLLALLKDEALARVAWRYMTADETGQLCPGHA